MAAAARSLTMAAFEKILALDSSGAACSAALWRRGAVVGRRFQAMTRGHAEALMPMVIETVAEAGESLHTLSAVAVTVGPGAFTGIRIGLAAARGIGLAANIPVVGVTTFAAVAEAVSEVEWADRMLLVLLDSKRGDAFVQEFASERVSVGPPAVLSLEAILHRLASGSFLLAGDGVAVVRPHLDAANLDVRYSAIDGPADARWVAQLAARSVVERTGLPPTPLYLRAPEVRSAPAAASGTIASNR
jgi:tRNA threonylcarbamoyladenosine biosynthesis protein TsaB